MHYLKVCPRCDFAAALDAAECSRCGHHYRTQFAPPVDPAQMVYGAHPKVATSPAKRSRGIAFFAAMMAIAVLVGGGFAMWVRAQQGFPVFPAVLPVTPTHRVWDYGASTVTMGQTIADFQEYYHAHAMTVTMYGGSIQPSTDTIKSEDTNKVLEILSSGRVYMADSESEVRLLETYGYFVHVQICSGHHTGQSGWTRKEWLHGLNDAIAPPPMPEELRRIAPLGNG